jgi:ligand-binding SRPBCC domain-containing protein
VGPDGFTDTQVSGPLKSWRHNHRFTALGPRLTRVDDHIVYEHHAGPRGLLTRLLFARPGLLYLFTARKLLTRRGVDSAKGSAVTDRAAGGPVTRTPSLLARASVG